MSLATRCPQCNTLFKVTSGQLQVHGGQVRCGHCKHVFSGIDHLTSADTEAWETARLETEPSSTPPGTTTNTIANNAASKHADMHTQPSFLLPPAQAKPGPTQLLHTLARTCTCAPRAWQLGVASLLLLALLQLGWLVRQPVVKALGWPSFQDSSVAVLWAFATPASRALVIEGSGLKAMDEHTLQVDITLHNPSRLPSHWPVLKLDLLDSQGLPLASKTLQPAEYQVLMREATQVAANTKPIAPKRTVEVQAYLNLKELHQHLPEAAATGFRLALFDTL